MKKGFTLVEVVLAVVMGAWIFAALASSFISSLQLIQQSAAETKISIASRQLRNRLLFNLSAPNSFKRTTGLLSASPYDADTVLEGGDSKNIMVKCPVLGQTFTDVESPLDVRLLVENNALKNELVNNRLNSWLSPGDFSLKENSMSEMVRVEYDRTKENLLTIDFTMTANAGRNKAVNPTRVRIPIFGTVQTKDRIAERVEDID